MLVGRQVRLSCNFSHLVSVKISRFELTSLSVVKAMRQSNEMEKKFTVQASNTIQGEDMDSNS